MSLEVLAGVAIGCVLGGILAWLVQGKRPAPPMRNEDKIPFCPFRCRSPYLHYHYGADGQRYYYRGFRTSVRRTR